MVCTVYITHWEAANTQYERLLIKHSTVVMVVLAAVCTIVIAVGAVVITSKHGGKQQPSPSSEDHEELLCKVILSYSSQHCISLLEVVLQHNIPKKECMPIAIPWLLYAATANVCTTVSVNTSVTDSGSECKHFCA